ncbi:MAG: MotB family protein [Xanthomonadales bacterium]|nr:MotB family protein [Xanthomonadales bacterium]
MSDFEDTDPPEEEEGGSGAPAWMATFADLMSLLMCFFVLLLSFSEIEAKKYKQVAGSMEKAFGVQREVKTMEIPKGTSIIATEFSPGKPTRQVVNLSMQQETTNQYKQNLDFTDSGMKGMESDGGAAALVDSESEQAETVEINQEVLYAAQLLAQALGQEIDSGMIEVVSLPDRVLLRVRERGSFESGSATIRQSFYPILARLTQTLNKTSGDIVVEGHTDNVPISTYQYPSNWELSAARAAAFVHFMTKQGETAPERLEIRAHGETKPLAPNDSRRNRARNRRVEIALVMKPNSVDQTSKKLIGSTPEPNRLRNAQEG